MKSCRVLGREYQSGAERSHSKMTGFGDRASICMAPRWSVAVPGMEGGKIIQWAARSVDGADGSLIVSGWKSDDRAYGTPVAWKRSVNISLFQAASALNANARWQEVIAENMAASSVPGFKKQTVSFKAVEAGMMPHGINATAAERTAWSMPQGTTSTSFAQGEMKFTGVNTDVGLDGGGFFEVQLPNGASAYTRDGEFQLNGQGQLVTKQGFAVMSDSGPLQLDRASSDPITISADGTVSQGNNTRGTLKVVNFNKPELLTPQAGGVFVANDPSLQASSDNKPKVRQFYLEQANTTPVMEMANMITVMRASEANQRVIQMQDERMGRAITELGNPN